MWRLPTPPQLSRWLQRDRSIGGDGGIAAYANNQHRHIFDAKGINACRQRRAGSPSPFLAAATIRFAMISRTVQAVPKLRSDLQALSKASPIAEVAVSSNANVLDRNDIHRDLPKTYERERGRSVSQSPRLEAVSVMPESGPLMGVCPVKTDHLWTAR